MNKRFITALLYILVDILVYHCYQVDSTIAGAADSLPPSADTPNVALQVIQVADQSAVNTGTLTSLSYARTARVNVPLLA